MVEYDLEGIAQDPSAPDAPYVRVRSGLCTNVGLRRKENEDSSANRFPVYLVADGMGGHTAGALASGTVVEEILTVIEEDEFTTQKELNEAIAAAASILSRIGTGDRAPGSTLTGLAFSTHRDYPCARVFNIGDSRTYLLSGEGFSQITTDHSEIQEMKDVVWKGSATSMLPLPRQNVITRALGAGAGPNVPADLYVIPVETGDRYLMCSDGLSGEVTDASIERVCRVVSDPQKAADELVDMALNAGGNDNITAVVVDVVDAGPTWELLDTEELALTEESSFPCENTVQSSEYRGKPPTVEQSELPQYR